MNPSAETQTFFSPGEVIFFGEHSVVYGRAALGAAISRGITVTVAGAEDGRLTMVSRLGRYEADIHVSPGAGSPYLENQRGDRRMLPLGKAFERIFKEHGRARALRVQIESDIPEESGLASSAAVSSALAAAALWAVGCSIPDSEEMVRRVYAGEIDLQKRGSVMGSACTVNGGFIAVRDGRWERVKNDFHAPKVMVIDSLERCATAVTTGRVKELLDRDGAGTTAIFDRMDGQARRGQLSMERGDWAGAGKEMIENQACLKSLGVSTPKIDGLIEAVLPFVYGAKITGAGGGGCIVCLPRPGAEEALAAAARKSGGETLECQISRTGIRGDSLCKR